MSERGFLLPAAALLSMSACASHERNPGAAAESAALAALRDQVAVLATFHRSCGGYPADLTVLVSSAPGGCATTGASIQPPRALRPPPPEYALVYRPVDAKPDGMCAHYELRATWIGDGAGRRNFWVSDAGIIRAAEGGKEAGPTDPELR